MSFNEFLTQLWKKYWNLWCKFCKSHGFSVWSVVDSASRSNAGTDPSPRLSKQLCFRSQGSLANKLTGGGETDGGDVDTQLTKMDVVLTFQIEVTFVVMAITAI